MNQEFTRISDHIEVISRRGIPCLFTFLFIFFSAALFAVKLPATYQSEAKILIESQEIPEEFVQSTITTFADEQIQIIAQRVMTRQNLEEIVTKFSLYNAAESESRMSAAIRTMRGSIFIQPVRASVVDQRTQRTGQVTIAFTVAFVHGDPQTAKQVTKELAELFLMANAAQRTQVTSETTDFLESEANQLKGEIVDTEARMAWFKEKYSDSLPELSDLNFQQLERAERDLEQVGRDIRGIQGRIALLQAELINISPYATTISEDGKIISTEDRLTKLQRELLTKSSIYSEDHPDIVRLKREIALLSGTTQSAANVKVLTAELEATSLELDEARQQYSSDHPDVRRLNARVTALESQISQAQQDNRPESSRRQPNNPRYLQLQAQRDLANQELSALYSQQSSLRNSVETYKDRLTRTPQTEREWLRLTRDYQVSVDQYREIRAQIDEANQSEALESAQKGERFTLLDPARLPSKPISPNRPLIFFFGLVVATALAVGLAIVLETIDTHVRGSKDIMMILGGPPIATIPILRNSADLVSLTRRKMLITAGFAATIVIAFSILV